MALAPETGHLLTKQQVADRLNISERQVRRLSEAGLLHPIHLGHRLRRWDSDDVEQLCRPGPDADTP